ncbi:MAG: flagellar hook-basal body complex protein FliE [Candidatus Midichloriaceae bacterium]|jgi:flagellar hook-basal body complex protein FliE
MVTISSYNKAVDAYTSANKQAKNLSSLKSDDKFVKQSNDLSILKSGDNLSLVNNVSKSAQFSSIVNEVLKEKIEKVRKSEKASVDGIMGKKSAIEVMAALNESEMAIQELIAVRDKLVSSYMDVLKMPL